MAEIVNSLFGIDPLALQQQQASTDFNRAFQFAQLDPFQRANMALYQSGSQLTRGVGQLLGGDDQLNRATSLRNLANQFDLTTPEGLRQYAEAAAAIDPRVSAQAAAEAERRTLVQARTVSALRERQVNPQTQAEQDYLNSLYAKYPDTVEGRAQAANEFAEWKTTRQERVSKAGAPTTILPGAAKPTDLRTGREIVMDLTKESKARLDTINRIGVWANNIVKQGSTASVPQLQRELVKLAGDNQIGQNEVRNILGSSGFAGNIIEGVNRFFTGLPTDLKMTDILKAVQAIEGYYAKQYNQGRSQAQAVLSNSQFDPQIVSTLVGPEYKVASEKAKGRAAPAVGAVVQGYRFKGGNPADQKNWELVK